MYSLAIVAVLSLASAHTSGSESCWRRRQFAQGVAVNPNKLISQQMAKRNYASDAESYARYCPADEGCELTYDSVGLPFCTAVGPNWQCQSSGEVYCQRETGGQ
jgi:hypothetical protein